MTKPTGYHSYLLRMWQTCDEEEHTWHISLEQPGTQERQSFAALDELFDFLRNQTAPRPGQTGGPVEELSNTATEAKSRRGSQLLARRN